MNNGDQEYMNLLNQAKQELDHPEKNISEEKQKHIVLSGKNRAKWTNIFSILTVLLLIIPVLTLMTYVYYAWGDRANTLIAVVDQTMYMTEPNVSIDEMKLETKLGFFTMDMEFDLFKRVGKDDITIGSYSIPFLFGKANLPTRNYKIDSPPVDVPQDKDNPFSNNDDWSKVEHLPEGTVTEAYVSFNKVYSLDDTKALFKKYDLDVRWYAVNTGLEDKDQSTNGHYLIPIGFPAQVDPNRWSPYNGDKKNEEVFIESLKFLQKHEKVATTVSHGKELDLTKRLNYINQHGITVYGAVITGPTKEILKLKEEPFILSMKRGEVRLWNWGS